MKTMDNGQLIIENYQLSTINYQLKSYQLLIINSQLKQEL